MIGVSPTSPKIRRSLDSYVFDKPVFLQPGVNKMYHSSHVCKILIHLWYSSLDSNRADPFPTM